MQRLTFRQGDVLVVQADTAPDRLEPVPLEAGRLILAHGEVTGHAHVVVGEAELFTSADLTDLEERFLRVAGDRAQLVHDEHATLDLPPGDYIVRRQREYTPEEIRTVAD